MGGGVDGIRFLRRLGWRTLILPAFVAAVVVGLVAGMAGATGLVFSDGFESGNWSTGLFGSLPGCLGASGLNCKFFNTQLAYLIQNFNHIAKISGFIGVNQYFQIIILPLQRFQTGRNFIGFH